jgi:Ca-activated chloride channel family protein
MKRTITYLPWALLLALGGCSGNSASPAGFPVAPADNSGSPAGSLPAGAPPPQTIGGGTGNAGTGGSAGVSPSAPTTPGSFGNVGVSGGQDFAAFRRALADGHIPSAESLDATGFFAEHFTSLPPPTCGRTFCLHGLVSVSTDLARGGQLTLLQMAMNSTVDPATVTKPPLQLAVVLDHSGSMAAAGKMDFARQGVKELINALAPEDTFTLIVFDDQVKTLFGPARVTDKAGLLGTVDEIQPAGGTDIYAGLEAGYRAVLASQGDAQQRRVIFLTDGLPTSGNTDVGAIRAMSLGYNQRYVGLTTIGLGSDVNVALLRGLAESGGGNFYDVEKPEAVKEIFTEELKFFVAPIAYDLRLSFTQLPEYSLRNVYGTALWQATTEGGRVDVPSVFLVSRTSSDPGPNGGRRGGGSAILAELSPTALAAPGALQTLGRLTLQYRLPGQTAPEMQDVPVTYMPAPAIPGSSEVPDYYSGDGMEKNTLMLDFYLALRDATQRAQSTPRDALQRLTAFQEKMTARLQGRTDADLLDDLNIVGQFIAVLQKAAP